MSATFAVFRNYVNLLELAESGLDTVFVSVRCGPEPVTFRILGEHVKAELETDHPLRGEVCPGGWVYHYFDMPAAHPTEAENATALLRVDVHAFAGSVDFTIASEHPPIRIAPPYGSAGAGQDSLASVCGAEAGYRYYIGVLPASSSGCSVYDIELSLTYPENCTWTRQSAQSRAALIKKLKTFTPYKDTCQPEEYVAYSIEVDEEHKHDNLVVEVELTDESYNGHGDTPESLEVLLFYNEITGGYATELRAERGTQGIWSVAVNAHDMKQGTWYVVVKCQAFVKRYRVVALLIESQLILGHRHHGELCENSWVYHIYRHAQGGNSTAQQQGGHRLRRALALAAHDDDAANSSHHGGTHLSFHIWRYSGEFFITGTHEYAPIKLVPPYIKVAAPEIEASLTMCNVDQDAITYFGIYGGRGCALYDVVAHSFTGECQEVKKYENYDPVKTSTELQLEHFTRASCAAFGYTAFYLNVTEDFAEDNIVFEVEDLSSTQDPEALTVLLFEDTIPSDKHSELQTSFSSDGIYSLAISSHDLHPGVFFLLVRCNRAPVRFRVAPLAIHTKLEEGHVQHGELCPGGWIYHTYTVNSTEVPDPTRPVHIRAHFWKYLGDFHALSRRDQPPVKLSPPYQTMGTLTHELDLDLCNVETGHVNFFALHGGDYCAVYDVILHVHQGPCNATEKYVHSSNVDTSTHLNVNGTVYSSCDPHEWADFYLPVTGDLVGHNLLFEVGKTGGEEGVEGTEKGWAQTEEPIKGSSAAVCCCRW